MESLGKLLGSSFKPPRFAEWLNPVRAAMNRPSDIHEHVLALAAEIANTWRPDDARARWRLYSELSDYCDSVAAAGRDHPFLWETLADFTTDDRIATNIYLRALSLATAAGAAEYQASICLALAQRHVSMGGNSLAYDFACRANAHAMQADDLDIRQQISQFLLDHSDVWAD